MLLKIFLSVLIFKFSSQNFSRLRDFTCEFARDELENHPEMRTIAMIELENNFPQSFSREILKCLPSDVAKIIFNPHDNFFKKSSISLTKHSLIIYVADEIKWNVPVTGVTLSDLVSPVVHYLSKFIIVASTDENIKNLFVIFKSYKVANVAVIYVKNHEINVQIPTRMILSKRKLDITHFTFKDSNQKNLSTILFNGKINLNGFPLFVSFTNFTTDNYLNDKGELINRWTFFVDILAQKLNASVNYIELCKNCTTRYEFRDQTFDERLEAEKNDRLDLDLSLSWWQPGHSLITYTFDNYCFTVPMPSKYSIYELILFLPLDKSCWMWLAITIALSAVVWRLSEGPNSHWNFIFGVFTFFVGQSTEIRSYRLVMKFLVQNLIFALFLFSNGYQGIVTSFNNNNIF